MIKIGITGQAGFVGKHLYNTLGLFKEKYERVDFDKSFFDDNNALDAFVKSCDVIVHLAAMNRHNDANVIYNTNIELVTKLIASLERTSSKAHVLFSSSTQEERDNLYGKSKKEGRELFIDWVKRNEAQFTGLVIPNVFGSFGHPYYNSVVATFCHQISHGETPKVDSNGNINLIYVGELVSEFIKHIDEATSKSSFAETFIIKHNHEITVLDLLDKITTFYNEYQKSGIIPELKSSLDYLLFNTFRCYMPIKTHFPVKFVSHKDPRGAFTEIIRLNVGGQVSFSTTVPQITRGNHFHTRKIERFAVIKGKALIQLRQIGTDEVLDFYLDGDEPAYVDMPIWYTHNIKNIGEEELYTIFWINEFYDPADPDTYFEEV
ncbi:MAG: NAD-dependent epimerase/dehydratase family protein [Bacteroidetes bacterium]|nr:NAD-dependent epimerase/dehydratase family protein [Bacteroidota bacterium]